MAFCLFIFQILMTISSIQASFEIAKCDFESGDKVLHVLNNSSNEFYESFDKGRRVCLFIYLKELYNVDYLASVINLQFELAEYWGNVNLPDSFDKTDSIVIGSNAISIEESNLSYIDDFYPNLVIEERDFNEFDSQVGNPMYQSNFKRSKQNIFRQYFYLKRKRMLIKNFKFNLQARCVISTQNYPFVESPCSISLREGDPKRNFNYSIGNFAEFINKKFYFKKFKVEVVSLNKLCGDLNVIERNYLQPVSCFQLLIMIKSSKRFFFAYFMFTFLLLIISYLSLWIPIYNHTSRVAMLTLPIVGFYLLDQALLNSERLFFRESTSLHTWMLACLLYIGFMFFCHILAFYSLARVKFLVEKADIGYLSFMLKCANLVQDENGLTRHQTSIEQMNKADVKTKKLPLEKKKSPLKIESEQSSVDLKKFNSKIHFSGLERVPEANERSPPKLDVAKTDSLIKMDLLSDLELSLAKSKKPSSKTSLPFKVNSLSKTDLIFKSDTVAKTDLQPKKSGILKKGQSIRLATTKSVKIFENKGIQESESFADITPEIKKTDTITLKSIKSQKSDENILKQATVPKDTVAFDLHMALLNLKKDLMLAKNLDESKTDSPKKKTAQFLKEILGLRSQPKWKQKKKKIVSRFISSSKLKTIEFISLIPSDEYARIALPVSFFLFFYFYSLHFIF